MATFKIAAAIALAWGGTMLAAQPPQTPAKGIKADDWPLLKDGAADSALVKLRKDRCRTALEIIELNEMSIGAGSWDAAQLSALVDMYAKAADTYAQLTDNPSEKLAFLNALGQKVSDVEVIMKKRFETGTLRKQDLLTVRMQVLEFQIRQGVACEAVAKGEFAPPPLTMDIQSPRLGCCTPQRPAPFSLFPRFAR